MCASKAGAMNGQRNETGFVSIQIREGTIVPSADLPKELNFVKRAVEKKSTIPNPSRFLPFVRTEACNSCASKDLTATSTYLTKRWSGIN